MLVRDDEPACWWLAQDYVGPDGVERTPRGLRRGAAGSSRTRAGVVLPHERTHAGPKEGRLRLLRATRAQLEPIFLLYDGDRSPSTACGEPDLDVERGRRVRTGSGGVPATRWPELADAQLLIADGHHRYETALAFHEEDGTEATPGCSR